MNNLLPAFILFDLDNTLANSKQPIDQEMADILSELLTKACVGVISGGMFSQLDNQVAAQLPPGTNIEQLYLLPTSGGALYSFDGAWKKKYEETLTENETERIVRAIEKGIEESGVIESSTQSYGDRIEARGAQVTFSALGQQAPWPEKHAWDPDMSKRHKLQEALIPLLPGFDVKIGGSTSIDITKRGVNKAFGIRKLSEQTDTAIGDMLYVGDELSSGGNDEVVKETGIATQAVQNPEETKKFIRNLLAQSAQS